MKFYGLPAQVPEDRHKWFFSFRESVEFVRERSRLNGMHIRQIDATDLHGQGGRRLQIKAWALRTFLAQHLGVDDIFWPTMWAVLEKQRP